MTTQRQAPEIGLTWEAPPEKTANGRGRQANPELVQIAKDLQANPNSWGKVAFYRSGSSASAMAGRINKGHLPWDPEGSFEALSRAGVVYARYVGSDAPDETAPVAAPDEVVDPWQAAPDEVDPWQ